MTALPTWIERTGVVPYYHQLKAILVGDIGRGVFADSKLPSESELCRRFGVSRTVVRQALDEMEQEGLIYKVKGRGAFVTGRKLEASHVQEVAGFYASMTGQGHMVRSRILRQEVVPASPHIALALALDVGEPVLALDRVRNVDDIPISVVRAALPIRLFPTLEDVDLRDSSLYSVIAERFGRKPHHGNRTIEAIAIAAVDAHHLGVRPGSPALRLESVVRSEDDVPFETFVAVYRGDRSKLDIRIVPA